MAFTRCGGGSEKPTLLWTNPNPNSTFASQTINIDLRNYQSIGFEVKNRQYDSQYPTRDYTTYIKRKKMSYDALGCASGTTTTNYPFVRAYNINTNGSITFSNGISTYDSSSAPYAIIPLKIYGYKKAIN